MRIKLDLFWFDIEGKMQWRVYNGALSIEMFETNSVWNKQYYQITVSYWRYGRVVMIK